MKQNNFKPFSKFLNLFKSLNKFSLYILKTLSMISLRIFGMLLQKKYIIYIILKYLLFWVLPIVVSLPSVWTSNYNSIVWDIINKYTDTITDIFNSAYFGSITPEEFKVNIPKKPSDI
jgi:hypothetical protein